MDNRGMHRRALARLVDPVNPEQARRALNRHLKGTHAPSRTTRHRYADALGIPREALQDDDEEDDSLERFMADLMGAVDAYRARRETKA